MKKFITLYRFVGFVSFLKVLLHVVLRRLDKKLIDFSIEFYKLSNFIQRQRGTINDSDKSSIVSFPFLGSSPTFHVRNGTSDAQVLIQVFEKLEYQSLIVLIRNFPSVKINSIIDAGANAGFTSVFFKLNFPEAKIISVEPDPGNFGTLETNLALNQVLGRAMKKAVWGSEEKVKISRDFRDHREWSRQVEKAAEGDSDDSTLEGITLEGILAQEKWKEIDVLKMDIEGGEENVFADPAATMALLAKLKFIAIELHDEISFRQQFEDYLKQTGFIYTNTGETLIGFNKKLLQN